MCQNQDQTNFSTVTLLDILISNGKKNEYKMLPGREIHPSLPAKTDDDTSLNKQ